MNIIKSIIVLFICFFLVHCSDNKNIERNLDEKMLKVVFSINNHHLQYQAEIDYLRKHSIKTMSFATHKFGSSEKDSVTYLQYNPKGLIEKRTTTECTTAGCLPYITRQEFEYNIDSIILFRNYTYKRKYPSTRSYWLLDDLSQLAELDYEEYNYKNDTVNIVSAPFSWNYIHNTDGKLKKIITKVNTTNQIDTMKYQYEKSSIDMQLISTMYDFIPITKYIIEDNSIIIKYKRKGPELISEKWNYNSEGLLNERINYRNGEEYSVTEITYEYFEN